MARFDQLMKSAAAVESAGKIVSTAEVCGEVNRAETVTEYSTFTTTEANDVLADFERDRKAPLATSATTANEGAVRKVNLDSVDNVARSHADLGNALCGRKLLVCFTHAFVHMRECIGVEALCLARSAKTRVACHGQGEDLLPAWQEWTASCPGLGTAARAAVPCPRPCGPTRLWKAAAKRQPGDYSRE